MNSLRSIWLATALLAVGSVSCVPARLEVEKSPRVQQEQAAADLYRAFEGAQDPAAKRALGEWVQAYHVHSQLMQVGPYRVRFAPSDAETFGPGLFDRLEPASRYRVERMTRHQVEGDGVPMLAVRENDGSALLDPWHPPEGVNRAVTAVALRSGNEVEIRLVDRMKVERLRINGRTRNLAGDFTVSWAALLEKASPLQRTALTSLLQRKAARPAGFFMVERYDPQRTPLILVHGLISTPIMYAELTNELWADPELRRRYQVWHYLYPTNAPPLYSARVMRGKLDELRRALDPDESDPAMKRTVIVAHSMGGLLSKSLVVDPDDQFWNAAFTRPISQLDLTSSEKATLQEAFFWEPRPHVDRIVFCSVPFRGSKMAESWIGRFGRVIAAPNDSFQDFYREVERKNPGMLQPDYESLTQGKLTSVLTLAPRGTSMTIFDELPIQEDVGVHTIIGTRGRKGPLEKTSDGVVPYSSSHLANAESELPVPYGHESFDKPEVIAEIKRVLKLPPSRPWSGGL